MRRVLNDLSTSETELSFEKSNQAEMQSESDQSDTVRKWIWIMNEG